jgi:hypothetical protein
LLPSGSGWKRTPLHFNYSNAFALGPSNLLYAASRGHGRVDAYRLDVPAETRTICRTEHDKTGLAIAPGGDLVVAVEGTQRGRGRAARLLRVDPRGETRWTVELNERSFGKSLYGPVVDGQGTIYMAFPGLESFARDGAGAVVFERPYAGQPVALAGESGEVLVALEVRALRFLDARTGVELASHGSAFYRFPKVDARGFVYVVRGDDLVCFSPRGEVVSEIFGIATRTWDFALAGDGRIFVLPHLGSRIEFVVVE